MQGINQTLSHIHIARSFPLAELETVQPTGMLMHTAVPRVARSVYQVAPLISHQHHDGQVGLSLSYPEHCSALQMEVWMLRTVS